MATRQKSNEQIAKSKVRIDFPRNFVFLCSLFFALCSFELYAQNSGYSMDTSGEVPRFVQRLSWIGDEYASRYEVIIEREERGVYRQLLREFTTSLFIEVSLAPGKYRFHVIPYDFLNQPGESSRINFEVLPYLSPEPVAPPESVVSSKPADTSESVAFLETAEEIEEQKGPKQFDLFLSAGWMPQLPIYYKKEEQFPGSKPSLAGAAVRLGMVLTKWDSFKPGLELAATWCSVDTEQSTDQSFAFGLNFVVQEWFPNEKMAFTFRVGAGYTMLADLQFMHTNMGISFLWIFTLNLYMETGIDYNHWLTESLSACLRPWVGIGWRF